MSLLCHCHRLDLSSAGCKTLIATDLIEELNTSKVAELSMTGLERKRQQQQQNILPHQIVDSAASQSV